MTKKEQKNIGYLMLNPALTGIRRAINTWFDLRLRRCGWLGSGYFFFSLYLHAFIVEWEDWWSGTGMLGRFSNCNVTLVGCWKKKVLAVAKLKANRKGRNVFSTSLAG